MKRSQLALIAGLILLVSGVVYLGYGPDRSRSVALLAGYAVAFAGYLLLTTGIPKIIASPLLNVSFPQLLLFAVGLRLALFLAPITWTDDHYRYIWDGICSMQGISPFAHTPDELVRTTPDVFSPALFTKLNSPHFHTVYPPVAQVVFATSAWIGGGDVWRTTLVLRGWMIAFEILTLLGLAALLKHHAQRAQLVALYALNPLVLLEFSVNLHSEALMIAPCLFSVVLFQRQRYDASAMVLAIAAAAKLWPLLFLAWIPARLGIKQSLRFIAITVAVFLASWIPLYTSDMLPHFISSLKLYVNYLEFNGALFEGLRYTLGDGLVKGTGLLTVITLIALAAYTLLIRKREEVPWSEAMLWLLAIYLFGAQAVHPWYILPLVAFATLTRYRWPMYWSLLIVPTYLTYGGEPYRQPYGWVAVEYVILVVVIIVELWGRSQQPGQFSRTSAEPVP